MQKLYFYLALNTLVAMCISLQAAQVPVALDEDVAVLFYDGIIG